MTLSNAPLLARQAGTTAISLVAMMFTGCLAMNPKPAGYYQPAAELSRLVVTETFKYTAVTGLAKVHVTFTIPAGVYTACAADADGTYYLLPDRRMPIHTLFPDSYNGGIYRRNSSPPEYFPFSGGPAGGTEMDALTRGQYPTKVEQIPLEFANRIKLERPR